MPIPPPLSGEDPVPPLPGSGQDQTPGYTSASLLWRITSPDIVGNLIEPSIRYGHVPGDAMEQMPPTPLAAGEHYIVELDSRPPDLVENELHWRTLFQP